MATSEQMAQWYTYFTAFLNPNGSSEYLTDDAVAGISIYRKASAELFTPFSTVNPFSEDATPEERKAGITALYEAAQTGDLHIPDSDGKLSVITINANHMPERQPLLPPQKPAGNAFTRFLKRAVNKLNSNWFKEDVAAEKRYHTEKVRYESLKKAYTRNANYSLSKEENDAARIAAMKERKLHAASVKTDNALNVLPPFRDLTDLASTHLSPQAELYAKTEKDIGMLADMEKYTAAYVFSKGDPSTITAYLQDTSEMDPVLSSLVEQAQNQYISEKMAHDKDGTDILNPYRFHNPEMVSKGLYNLCRCMENEDQLSNRHSYAAIYCQTLIPKMNEELAPEEIDTVRYANALVTMGSVYAEGLQAKSNLLHSTNLNRNYQAENVGKVAVMEAVNTALKKSCEQKAQNLQAGILEPTEVQKIMMAREFTKENLLVLAMTTPTVQRFANMDAEPLRNMIADRRSGFKRIGNDVIQESIDTLQKMQSSPSAAKEKKKDNEKNLDHALPDESLKSGVRQL